ncbi:MAG: Transcriptional regulator, AcrR family [uncultured Nocardioidaceae bacterium]|uniref:Transcriptional regulator, AcrR family n=1 Tax=uncultured Nocardioidaceae bacterium TaxID=253824 RepID=A0A6J4M8J5_9ACTN|nr:MAG: Transcriptional regulator, AcrR family [uncultured Nocardioidaceae bacterium]
MSTVPMTRRERQRQATVDEIVEAARSLLSEPGGLSLRAVAVKMGMTAPALYRYVDDYQGLLRLVTRDIDHETAAMLREARDSQPEDDPAAQIICAAVAFRRWALARREEFALVFANPLAAPAEGVEDLSDQQTGYVFTELLFRLWRKYDFPLPDVADLDPLVVDALAEPMIPAKVDDLPEEARTLVWVCMQSWAQLYGVVTLEVFGHCDPRIIDSAAMFRSMLSGQALLLGISAEVDRLAPLIDAWLGRSD